MSNISNLHNIKRVDAKTLSNKPASVLKIRKRVKIVGKKKSYYSVFPLTSKFLEAAGRLYKRRSMYF